jgi:hypothetical protein
VNVLELLSENRREVGRRLEVLKMIVTYPPKTHARFVLQHSWSVANEELVGTDVA